MNRESRRPPVIIIAKVRDETQRKASSFFHEKRRGNYWSFLRWTSFAKSNYAWRVGTTISSPLTTDDITRWLIQEMRKNRKQERDWRVPRKKKQKETKKKEGKLEEYKRLIENNRNATRVEVARGTHNKIRKHTKERETESRALFRPFKEANAGIPFEISFRLYLELGETFLRANVIWVRISRHERFAGGLILSATKRVVAAYDRSIL